MAEVNTYYGYEIQSPNLTTYQNKFLYCKQRFTIVESSTKAGKTFSHIWWLFERAHRNNGKSKEGANFWWVAPVYNQSKIAFKRMCKYIRNTDGYTINKSDLSIVCPNGAEIHFKSAQDPDNLYGEDVHDCVWDEFSRLSDVDGPEVFAAIRSTLTKTHGKLKMIGNHTGKKWVEEMKKKANTDPDKYAYFKITAWDAVKARILTEKEVLQAKKDLPDSVFRALYLAEPVGEEGQLIEKESLAKLWTNPKQNGQKYITIDVARMGRDRSVIFVWDGLSVVAHKIIDSSTLTELAQIVRELKVKYNVNLNNIIADEVGTGAGLVDILGCQGFIANARPVDVGANKFASLKDQCMYKLAETINANRITLDLPEELRPTTIQELEQIKLPQEIDVKKIRLVGKDAIKKQIGRSPDLLDALAMRMYYLLRPHHGHYYITMI